MHRTAAALTAVIRAAGSGSPLPAQARPAAELASYVLEKGKPLTMFVK